MCIKNFERLQKNSLLSFHFKLNVINFHLMFDFNKYENQ